MQRAHPKICGVGMSELEQYVVCERDAAVLLHLRQGSFQECGKQDSWTLCERAPAWDTHIPVGIFDEPIVDPSTRRCKLCMARYHNRNSNERA